MAQYPLLGILGVLVLVAVACGAFPAQTGAEYKLQYVCLNRELGPCMAAEKFVERVFDRTNGRVEIKIRSFGKSELGDRSALGLVADGTLEMAEIYRGNTRTDLPILELDNLLGMYETFAIQEKVTEAIREDIKSLVAERSGGIVLAYQYYPRSYFFATRPLRTGQDVEGLNIRGHSRVVKDLLEGMRANPKLLDFFQVYEGLEDGTLDAAISCGACGSGLRWYEVASHLVGPIVASDYSLMIMNGKIWAELPPDARAVIIEEAKRLERMTKTDAATVWDQEGVLTNQDAGMMYTELTPELKELMREAALAKVLPRWVERTGGRSSEEVRIFNMKIAPILNIEIPVD